MIVEQGDLLMISGIRQPAVVVSNDFFNTSGSAIVCPIVKDTIEGPLHIRVSNADIDGYIMCEQVRYVDLRARRFSRSGSISFFDIQNISDAIMGMFDYQML